MTWIAGDRFSIWPWLGVVFVPVFLCALCIAAAVLLQGTGAMAGIGRLDAFLTAYSVGPYIFLLMLFPHAAYLRASPPYFASRDDKGFVYDVAFRMIVLVLWGIAIWGGLVYFLRRYASDLGLTGLEDSGVTLIGAMVGFIAWVLASVAYFGAWRFSRRGWNTERT